MHSLVTTYTSNGNLCHLILQTIRASLNCTCITKLYSKIRSYHNLTNTHTHTQNNHVLDRLDFAHPIIIRSAVWFVVQPLWCIRCHRNHFQVGALFPSGRNSLHGCSSKAKTLEDAIK